MVFGQSWCEIVTNASKMRCQKFGCKRNWSWLGFGLSQVGCIGFLCLGSKIGENWSHGFWAILVGKCPNVCKMRCEKFGCKWNSSWLGFGSSKLGGLAFWALLPKLVKKWSHGFWAIFVGNCHKCIQNEVPKVWLQKKLILVGFWLSQVWSHCLVFMPW